MKLYFEKNPDYFGGNDIDITVTHKNTSESEISRLREII